MEKFCYLSPLIYKMIFEISEIAPLILNYIPKWILSWLKSQYLMMNDSLANKNMRNFAFKY